MVFSLHSGVRRTDGTALRERQIRLQQYISIYTRSYTAQLMSFVLTASRIPVSLARHTDHNSQAPSLLSSDELQDLRIKFLLLAGLSFDCLAEPHKLSPRILLLHAVSAFENLAIKQGTTDRHVPKLATIRFTALLPLGFYVA